MIYQNTYSNQIREKIKKLNSVFCAADLQEQNQEKLRSVLKAMVKTGEITRVARGKYQYVGEKTGSTTMQQKAWKIIRARKKVTIEDIIELAGMTKNYAQDWLNTLKANGIVKKASKQYILIKDTVSMPINAHHAQYMKKYNKNKKAINTELDNIEKSIKQIRTNLNTLNIPKSEQGEIHE